MRVKGHDGGSQDLSRRPTIKGTQIQGKPKNGLATVRCGCCGTSDQITGRPGTSIERFTCRSCKSVNLANGGLGFTFWSEN